MVSKGFKVLGFTTGGGIQGSYKNVQDLVIKSKYTIESPQCKDSTLTPMQGWAWVHRENFNQIHFLLNRNSKESQSRVLLPSETDQVFSVYGMCSSASTLLELTLKFFPGQSQGPSPHSPSQKVIWNLGPDHPLMPLQSLSKGYLNIYFLPSNKTKQNKKAFEL